MFAFLVILKHLIEITIVEVNSIFLFHMIQIWSYLEFWALLRTIPKTIVFLAWAQWTSDVAAWRTSHARHVGSQSKQV